MIEWFVAHTRAKAETVAATNLARQGFAVYCPRYRKRWRHARREEMRAAPLFPRYIFVGMDIARARWRAISSTVGVSHLVGAADRPAPVATAIIDEIRAREDETGWVNLAPEIPFAPGDTVRVTTGALCDQLGLFEGVTDDERVTVLLDLLGREVRAKLPIETVAAYH